MAPGQTCHDLVRHAAPVRAVELGPRDALDQRAHPLPPSASCPSSSIRLATLPLVIGPLGRQRPPWLVIARRLSDANRPTLPAVARFGLAVAAGGLIAL